MLVTESGTASADSESLCSVATATAYHAARGNAAWAALDETEKEQALRKATDYMEQIYKGQWAGLRVSATQALDWPRVSIIANGYAVDSESVPAPVQRACAELALKSASGDLLQDLTTQKASAKVGPIEVTYNTNAPKQTQYAAVNAMLSPYLCNASGFVHKLVR